MPAYNATISVEYGGSDNEVSSYVTEISTVEELKLLRNSVNNGLDYKGVTVTLKNDIDLSGETWTPIGNGTRSVQTFSGNVFKGSFDGGNYSIKNLTISDSDSVDKSSALGLFGVVSGGTIKNINFESVNINTAKAENTGSAVGLLVDNSTVSNVKVLSGSLAGFEGLGGIVGRMTVQGTIKDCENNATISTATSGCKNFGGIVGATYYTEKNKEMYITNCANKGIINCNAAAIGGIVGLSAANVSGCTNKATVTNTGTGTSLGGIVGEQNMHGTISDCQNSGAITGESMGYGTGGIVGWIRYSQSVSYYQNYSKIIVTGNTNSGNIKGNGNAGGIVGVLYHAADITSNKNEATSLIINSGNFVAGIVGCFQTTENTQVGYNEGDVDVTFKGNSTCEFITVIDGDKKNLLIFDNSGKIVIQE